MDLSTLLSMLLQGGGQSAPMQPGFGPRASGGDTVAQMPGRTGGVANFGGGWQDILGALLRQGGGGPGAFGPSTQEAGQPYGNDMVARPMPMPQRQPPGRNQLANKPGMAGGRQAPTRPSPMRQAPTRSPAAGGGRQMYDDWSSSTGNRGNLSYEDFQKPSQANWFKDQWNNRNAG